MIVIHTQTYSLSFGFIFGLEATRNIPYRFCWREGQTQSPGPVPLQQKRGQEPEKKPKKKKNLKIYLNDIIILFFFLSI